jgi:predicted Zn-dependent peptidase
MIKHKKTEQSHVALGVHTVPVDHKDKYPLSILSAILGGGMSSRLFHEIREKRGLAYYVRTSSDHYQDVGSLVSTAGVDPKRIDDAIQVLVAEYKTISDPKNQISKSELNKAKEFLKGHLVLDLEDSRSVAGYYGSQDLLEKEIENPDQVLAKIDGVTGDDVERVAQKYLKPEGFNLAIIGNFEDGDHFEALLK